MTKKTIGLNPLEEYLSATREQRDTREQKAPEVSVQTQQVERTQASLAAEEQKMTEPIMPENGSSQIAGKQRITLHISGAVIDRVKNAVYWEPGLTLAGFAEEALERALNELEAERGSPFPQRREHRLRGGRPII